MRLAPASAKGCRPLIGMLRVHWALEGSSGPHQEAVLKAGVINVQASASKHNESLGEFWDLIVYDHIHHKEGDVRSVPSSKLCMRPRMTKLFGLCKQISLILAMGIAEASGGMHMADESALILMALNYLPYSVLLLLASRLACISHFQDNMRAEDPNLYPRIKL